MPATYTYNDAIEDSKREVMSAWEKHFDEASAEEQMRLILDIVGRLNAMKRPHRRKRKGPLLQAAQV